MNKKVKQLSEQATTIVSSDTPEYIKQWQETFYQLIVTECMTAVSDIWEASGSSDLAYPEVVIAIGDRFFQIDEELTFSNPVERVAKEATEYCCEQYKDRLESMAWLWEEAFTKLIVEECLDVVYGCDPSTKIITHEPYTSIGDAVWDHFYGEDE